MRHANFLTGHRQFDRMLRTRGIVRHYKDLCVAVPRNHLQQQQKFRVPSLGTSFLGVATTRRSFVVIQPPTPPPPAAPNDTAHTTKQQHDVTSADDDVFIVTLSSSSTPTRKSIQTFDPSFQVAKVSYDGEIAKLNMKIPQLLKATALLPRDLFTLNITSRQERRLVRRMDPMRRTIPAIVPKHDKIILSFGTIRAVASLDQIFLLDAHNPAVMDFAKSLATTLSQRQHQWRRNQPPELIFLECVLSDAIDSLHRRLRLFEPIVENFLDRVADEVYSDIGTHQLAPLKDSLQSFEFQIKQSLECLTNLLNDDDEMLALLLTAKAEANDVGEAIDRNKHEEVELILGVYARQLHNLSMEMSYILGRLQSKQEFVALALAHYRNRMIRMNVHIGVTGLALATCTTIAGFFGMNLLNGFEGSTVAFYYVLSTAALGGFVTTLTAFNYLSGSAMRNRAALRLQEIETITSALNNLCTVDYTLKSAIEKGVALDKESFRKALCSARTNTKVSQDEVDFLFQMLDTTKDGVIASDDFHPFYKTETIWKNDSPTTMDGPV